MPTKIKLMRRGKMRQPYYRIVVADARTKRDGRSIEEIGKYHPKADPSYMEVDADRIAYWLGVGAQPTDAVRAILKVTGDWQKFYGEPAPEPMRVKAPKPDRRAAFEAATQHAAGEPEAEATTPKKKAAPRAAAQPKAGESATDGSSVDAPTSATDSPADATSEESPVMSKASTAKAGAKAESSTAESHKGESPKPDSPTADKPEPAAEAKPKAAAKAAPKAAKAAAKPAAGPADDSAEPVAEKDSDA